MRTTTAALLAMTLAGCSAHSAAAGVSSSPRTVAQLEQAVGCRAGSVSDASGELFTSGAADCTTALGATSVRTFSDNANRDQWLTLTEAFGGGFLLGDRWAVKLDSRDDAVQLQAKLGGSVR